MNPLIHIGYHKTGTTWLQRFLFDNPDAGFWGAFKRDKKSLELLVYTNSLDFDANECKRYFYQLIRNAIANSLVPVLSQERLSGSPHSGGYDSKEIANRLAGVFPEGKVLIVIREQTSMILSTYSQYVNKGGPCPLTNYLQRPSQGRGKAPLFNFDHFKYHRLIGYYINLFGKANVLVLPFELLKDKPQDFVSQIVGFSGVKPESKTIENLPFSSKLNKQLSPFEIFAKRRSNYLVNREKTLNPGVIFSSRCFDQLLRRCLERVDAVMPGSVQAALDKRLKATISEMVGNRYKESNNCTAEMLKLDLGKYGYDV